MLFPVRYGCSIVTEMTQNRRRTTVEAAVINYLILETPRNEHDINLGHKGPFFKVSETLRHNIHEMKMFRRCSEPKSKMPLQCLFRTLPYCVGTVKFVTAVANASSTASDNNH